MSGLGRKFGGDVSELGIECIEFLAQDELITILPKFKMPEINLIAGSIGPFEPQHPVDVPLWLAIQLRKEGKCSIITPDWLDNEYLAIKETSERSDEKNFTDMPYHHHEIATMLFKTYSSLLIYQLHTTHLVLITHLPLDPNDTTHLPLDTNDTTHLPLDTNDTTHLP
ncbi:hypothetical protein AAMO2058_001390500 [Amorphochlora amoebiformis]